MTSVVNAQETCTYPLSMTRNNISTGKRPPARIDRHLDCHLGLLQNNRSTFDPGNPEAVFNWNYFLGTGRSYDVSPDGQQFLVLNRETGGGEDTPSPQIITVLSWFEELKERVPVP